MGDYLKKEAWKVCRFKGGLGKKEGGGVFERGLIPQCTLCQRLFFLHLIKLNNCGMVRVNNKYTRDHSFSTYAKFTEKLTFRIKGCVSGS